MDYESDMAHIVHEDIEEPSDPSMKSKFAEFKRIIRKNSRSRYTPILSLSVIALLAIGSVALSQRLLHPVAPNRSQANSVVTLSPGLESLAQQRSAAGVKVPVAVILNFNKTPESKLTKDEITTQRTQIHQAQDQLLASLPAGSFEIVARYDFSPTLSLKVTPAALTLLKQQPAQVTTVLENRALQGPDNLKEARVVVGANLYETPQNGGLNGNGYTVAVIDTGVQSDHPFLSGQVIGEACFGNDCLKGNSGPGTAYPDCDNVSKTAGHNCGHGTAVAGIVAGKLTPDGYQGIASGVKVVAVKAVDKSCDSTLAAGSQCRLDFSYYNVALALEWISDNLSTYNIGSVNASLGDPYANVPCDDAITQYDLQMKNAIDTLYVANIPVVFSGGNAWDQLKDKMAYPGCYSRTVMVASAEKNKTMSSFTNIGSHFNNVVLAVGGNVTTASVQTNPNGLYAGSGSSLAAPEVASAFAILKQIAPTASVPSLLQLLKDTGDTVQDTRDASLPGSYKLIRIDKAIEFLRGTGSTAFCTGTSGTSTSCNMAGSTLGASTENTDETKVKGASTSTDTNGQVLQASTVSYGDLLLMTVAYRAHNNPNAQVASLTYTCGGTTYNLNRLVDNATNRGRASFTDQHAEMWYMINPPKCSSYSVKATFCNEVPCVTQSDPEDRVITSTVFHNIPQSDFVVDVRIAGYAYPPGSTFFNPSNTGPKDSRFVCTYSNYPNGGQNKITSIASGWRNIWTQPVISGFNNIQTALGATDPRTTDNQLVSMKWTGTQSWPWAAVCIDLKTKPASAGTGTPAPLPTATPVPKTSVNLKINGSDGPVSVTAGDILNFSWTAASANTCTASGGVWTGGKSITTGTDTQIAIAGSTKYTITCVGNATATDSVTVTAAPKVTFLINGKSSVTLDSGIAPTLRWVVQGATSCTASGSWTGTKAATAGAEKPVPPTATAKYILSCTGAGGTTLKTVGANLSGVAAPIGFRTNYYKGQNFQTLVGSQVLTTINTDWGTTQVPFTGMPLDYYSIRYAAQITPPTTGTYTFLTTSDERVRVYVDNVAVIYDWFPHGRVNDQGTIALTAGKKYNLVIEYSENLGSATMVFQSGIGANGVNLNPVAIDPLLAMNNGGIKGDFYSDSTYATFKGETVVPVLDFTNSSNALDTYLGSYGIYFGTFVPTVTSTYTITGGSMSINGIGKTAALLPDGKTGFTIALTANVPYSLSFFGPGKSASYMWKYGTLPYTPLDFRNVLPL